MNPVSSVTSADTVLQTAENTPKPPTQQSAKNHSEFKKVFHQFVGEVLYGQLVKAMRQTQQKPAYFDGGRAEEIFQQQLDQVLVEKMSKAGTATITDPMFNLLTAKRT
ncbi:MAG: rod-binding protein [Planctomycetaceae bacterium]|jgi:Rod binding domain-containing protein|nr:rod-binding protein [Planctomycetaceae bacterium]